MRVVEIVRNRFIGDRVLSVLVNSLIHWAQTHNSVGSHFLFVLVVGGVVAPDLVRKVSFAGRLEEVVEVALLPVQPGFQLPAPSQVAAEATQRLGALVGVPPLLPVVAFQVPVRSPS